MQSKKKEKDISASDSNYEMFNNLKEHKKRLQSFDANIIKRPEEILET